MPFLPPNQQRQSTEGKINKQTKRQTDKQIKKLNVLAAWRQMKSEPHQTRHGDRQPQAHSHTSKTFAGLT